MRPQDNGSERPERKHGAVRPRKPFRLIRGGEVGGLISYLVGALSPVNHKGFYQGLRETFIKRHTVERTNKAEIRPE